MTTKLTFLGTGPYLATDRYWNGFVIDDQILVEPSPTALPHLHRCGIDPAGIDVVAISHFHADHTFGWPFLLFELMQSHQHAPLFVVGPPGVEAYLARLMDVAGVPGLQRSAHRRLDIRYVEADGAQQVAGPLRFRAVEVDHVDHLECFGYLFEREGSVLGYTGDTGPCAGLDTLAEASATLVIECNGPHHRSTRHMDVEHVAALQERFPDVDLVLTHLGAGLDLDRLERCTVPEDFQVIEVR